VAVDDQTWAAFREICGTTPASIRLGKLVAAEVARARSARREAPAALEAIREIQRRAAELEQLMHP
jgi:hypothetical protein